MCITWYVVNEVLFMAKKTSINLSIDPELKTKATQLFEEFGLDFSTAVCIFLQQAIREQKIPFEIKMKSPEEEILHAIEELDRNNNNQEKVRRLALLEKILKEIDGD